jgi:hypothetical protein
VDLQRARLPQTRAKGEYEMENTIKVLQHKVRGGCGAAATSVPVTTCLFVLGQL